MSLVILLFQGCFLELSDMSGYELSTIVVNFSNGHLPIKMHLSV